MIFKTMQEAVVPVMEKIFALPFNQELAQGILSHKKFIHYLQQDALFLTDFSRAAALIAGRLTCKNQAYQFMQFALSAINAEQSLHIKYLQNYNAHDLTHIEQSPVCFMYTNYLLRLASTASVEESVASFLPCFWVYREVGSVLAKTKTENNPYADWIGLYSGKEFNDSVDAAINITNLLGQQTSETIKHKMLLAFHRSTQLEWHFWDGAYREERW